MGLIVAIFFGTILLTSTVVIALPGLMEPLNNNPDVTITGTPADNYVDEQRPQFCGTGDAKSTTFVKEYKIPTECTNPLAITTDYDGNVWFAQSNTGNIAMFDPLTESFTEFDNPAWPDGGRSMMWGMDYAPDGSIWYTDEVFNSIWQFSPYDESYNRLGYNANMQNSLPQQIEVFGSDLIFNDFTGGNLVVLTPAENDASMFSIPPIMNGSVTSDFATDTEKNIWFTSWILDTQGILAKFNFSEFAGNPTNATLTIGETIDFFPLPDDAATINGVEYHTDGNIWLADTSSSFFFMFDPNTAQFTKFVTSDPDPSTYGNATGIYKSTPASRPYWIESTDDGRLVFNEHNANRIAVFDPIKESLVEYAVPSKNPNWADCLDMEDCGTSQVFGIAVDGEKVWFTQWVENNIGVVDTSVELPFDVLLDSDSIALTPGQSTDISINIAANSQINLSDLSFTAIPSDDALTVKINGVTITHNTFDEVVPQQDVLSNKDVIGILQPDNTGIINITIQANEDIMPGQYKILVGAGTDEVSIGKFLTVIT